MGCVEKVCARYESNPGFASASVATYPTAQLEARRGTHQSVSHAVVLLSVSKRLVVLTIFCVAPWFDSGRIVST
jgi:hypothetical protein